MQRRPGRALTAPVNAPFTWPKSADILVENFPREVVERSVDFLKVPRVLDRQILQPNFRIRGDRSNVLGNPLGQVRKLGIVEEFHPANEQGVVLAKRNGRTPAVPAVGSRPGVESRSEKAEHDGMLLAHILRIEVYPTG